MPEISLADRLAEPRPLLLDGPMGTELARRGVATDSSAWSAAALATAPDVVEQIHRDYRTAGAELLTANTFRTHSRNLGQLERWGSDCELTGIAVSLARSASGGNVWVAGSMAPLVDCYRPDLTPSPADLEREHKEMAEHLAECGVDVILAETHPTIREAAAAARAATKVGLPVMVSWVCGRDGRLLSGEALSEAVGAVLPLEPLAVLVNCLPAESGRRAVRELTQAAGNLPAGIYANVGSADAGGNWVQGASTVPAVYAGLASDWIDSGARLIGGCCGTTPEHILQLQQLLVGRAASPEPNRQ